MRYKIPSLLAFISIFLVCSCNIFNENAVKKKGIEIPTSTASGVAAMDVLQNEMGIFILGIAQTKEQKDSFRYDFYLACIDQNGRLKWEKTYGNAKGINRPNDMIATSDNHLLLVGYSITKGSVDINSHKVMHVVKVDYSGNIIWEKNYPYKYDNGEMGNNSGNAVIEVSDGYIIANGKSKKFGSGSGTSALTKISFDGNEIWSKAIGGYVHALFKEGRPDHFGAIGYFTNADLVSFKNANADTAHITNFTNKHFTPDGAAQGNGFIIISNNILNTKNGIDKLSLYKISQNGTNLLAKKIYPLSKPYTRQISLNIDALNNAIISTGYVQNFGTNPGREKAYALKINPDLSIDWQFIHQNTSKRNEEAVGAFALTGGGTGVIVNEYEPISNPCNTCSDNMVPDIVLTSINSHLILYHLGKDGKLRQL